MDEKKMSSREAALRAAASVRSATDRKKMDPELMQKLYNQTQNGWDIPIAPPKPNPEAAVNARIEAAASAPMPAEPVAEVPAAPLTPEEAQEAEIRQIRMQMLKEASKTGQMPAYLKKY